MQNPLDAAAFDEAVSAAEEVSCPDGDPNLQTFHGGTRFLHLGTKKAHQLLTHKLLEKAVKPGTTSWLTRRKCLFLGFGGETHKLFCPVNCWKGGKDPHPQDFSLTKRTARFTTGEFRPY